MALALKTWWQIGFNAGHEWIWLVQGMDCIRHILCSAPHPHGFNSATATTVVDGLGQASAYLVLTAPCPKCVFAFGPRVSLCCGMQWRKDPISLHPTCAAWKYRKLTFPGNCQPMEGKQRFLRGLLYVPTGSSPGCPQQWPTSLNNASPPSLSFPLVPHPCSWDHLSNKLSSSKSFFSGSAFGKDPGKDSVSKLWLPLEKNWSPWVGFLSVSGLKG